MEMLFHIVKQIYDVLSPAELFFILTLILGMIPVIIKIIAKVFSNRKVISAIIGAETDTQLENISRRLDDMMSKDDHRDSIEMICKALDEIKSQLNSNADGMQAQNMTFHQMQGDLQTISESLRKEIADIKHHLKMKDIHDQQSITLVKDVLDKIQENLQKLTSQIDKIDEFTRASIPEFRSYHKELSKEIGNLSRDIALVERSIQTQINTVNSVKLR